MYYETARALKRGGGGKRKRFRKTYRPAKIVITKKKPGYRIFLAPELNWERTIIEFFNQKNIWQPLLQF